MISARKIMDDFADRTGIVSKRPPRRYLWTDAFAVCNFLGLYRETGRQEYREIAVRLIDQVHYILGRHRPDDPRSGWISGLAEEEGEKHPTAGGLRIGKPYPERLSGEAFDEDLEWKRDGQYYHYLTKWMLALGRAGEVTWDETYHRWAAELAHAAHRGFTRLNAEGKIIRMCWKMSIDLSRPLVTSMGQHDPLDGLLTFCRLPVHAGGNGLADPISELVEFCRDLDWLTTDPLGLGGLLTDVYRAADLRAKNLCPIPDLPEQLLENALAGLEHFLSTKPLDYPPSYRLAFRELGLVIGMEAIRCLREEERGMTDRLQRLLSALKTHDTLPGEILSFWGEENNRKAPSWLEHEDINAVMLATALSPRGYLG